MKSGTDSKTNLQSGQWQIQLQAITVAVSDLSQVCQGDTLALLALLRRLEALHRQIRDGIFQASLPDNRQALYALLKNIEAEGGWPYIERMKLQTFLSKLPAEGEPSSTAAAIAPTPVNLESEG